MNNVLYCGDNLEHLRTLETDSVDLVYIDPPYFTNKKFAVISNDGEVRQFDDKWVSLQKGKYSKDINVYLNWMEPRIRELHRVLKKTGSFYLQCDGNAVHYLKVVCDKIFGMNRFLNQITWRRHTGKSLTTKKYTVNTDYILFYSKSSKYTYNQQFYPLPQSTIDRDYKLEEETGRMYAPQTLDNRGNSIKELKFPDKGVIKTRDGFGWKWTQTTLDERLTKNPNLIHWSRNGVPRYKKYLDENKGIGMDNLWIDIPNETERRYRVAPLENRGDKISELNFPDRGTVKARDGFGFKWTQATLDERLAKNPHLIYWSKNGIANYKVYLDDHKGISMDDLWIDIGMISSNSKERMDYPTQKPEALLERIIKTSSNEEDIVLDCFGGSGTTMAAAQRLNRQFIGMEVSPIACRIQAERLGLNIQDIIGMPL